MHSAQSLRLFGANLFRSFGEVVRAIASRAVRARRAARQRQLQRILRRGIFCVD